MKSFFSRLHDSTQTGHSKSTPKESYKFWNPNGDPSENLRNPLIPTEMSRLLIQVIVAMERNEVQVEHPSLRILSQYCHWKTPLLAMLRLVHPLRENLTRLINLIQLYPHPNTPKSTLVHHPGQNLHDIEIPMMSNFRQLHRPPLGRIILLGLIRRVTFLPSPPDMVSPGANPHQHLHTRYGSLRILRRHPSRPKNVGRSHLNCKR
ncbi:hypothetical protein BJ912DRAFT_501969 [Pholiota molesta]|nr:hypothetical protein BJ912DRAFT_501969 [Pholiota molesta]